MSDLSWVLEKRNLAGKMFGTKAIMSEYVKRVRALMQGLQLDVFGIGFGLLFAF